MKDREAKAHQTLVIGDSYQSDIVMAIQNNSKSILTDENSKHENPDVLIIRNLRELYRHIAED
jgi:ribonucleotide monophosphatase NagD (HAD superfamily)